LAVLVATTYFFHPFWQPYLSLFGNYLYIYIKNIPIVSGGGCDGLYTERAGICKTQRTLGMQKLYFGARREVSFTKLPKHKKWGYFQKNDVGKFRVC